MTVAARLRTLEAWRVELRGRVECGSLVREDWAALAAVERRFVAAAPLLADLAEAAEAVWEEDSEPPAFVGTNLAALGAVLARVAAQLDHEEGTT